MGQTLVTPGDTITLHAFTKSKADGSLKDQPVGYPKITIKKIGSGGVTTVLAATAMTEDIDGEYYYRWAVPSGNADYKVQYEALIDGVAAFGHDELLARVPTNLYDIEGIGTDRFNTIESGSATLEIQVYRNGVAFSPFSIARVEIYDDRDEAEKAFGVGVPIETIASVSITGPITVGKYNYAITPIATADLYWDKVYIVPEDGSAEMAFILPFYVRKVSVGGAPPGPIETCEITFNVRDLNNLATAQDTVNVSMNESFAWYDTTQIRNNFAPAGFNSSGSAVLTLVETDTLTADTGSVIFYTLTCGRYERRFTIPKGTISANLLDLPEYTGEEC